MQLNGGTAEPPDDLTTIESLGSVTLGYDSSNVLYAGGAQLTISSTPITTTRWSNTAYLGAETVNDINYVLTERPSTGAYEIWEMTTDWAWRKTNKDLSVFGDGISAFETAFGVNLTSPEPPDDLTTIESLGSVTLGYDSSNVLYAGGAQLTILSTPITTTRWSNTAYIGAETVNDINYVLTERPSTGAYEIWEMTTDWAWRKTNKDLSVFGDGISAFETAFGADLTGTAEPPDDLTTIESLGSVTLGYDSSNVLYAGGAQLTISSTPITTTRWSNTAYLGAETVNDINYVLTERPSTGAYEIWEMTTDWAWRKTNKDLSVFGDGISAFETAFGVNLTSPEPPDDLTTIESLGSVTLGYDSSNVLYAGGAQLTILSTPITTTRWSNTAYIGAETVNDINYVLTERPSTGAYEIWEMTTDWAWRKTNKDLSVFGDGISAFETAFGADLTGTAEPPDDLTTIESLGSVTLGYDSSNVLYAGGAQLTISSTPITTTRWSNTAYLGAETVNDINYVLTERPSTGAYEIWEMTTDWAWRKTNKDLSVFGDGISAFETAFGVNLTSPEPPDDLTTIESLGSVTLGYDSSNVLYASGYQLTILSTPITTTRWSNIAYIGAETVNDINYVLTERPSTGAYEIWEMTTDWAWRKTNKDLSVFGDGISAFEPAFQIDLDGDLTIG